MEIKVDEIKALEPIKFNYEELKNELSEKVKVYETAVYSEENIAIAKQDRANLKKLSKAINDEKIRVKNKILEPYHPIEQQFLELISIADKAANNIDTQVKDFEEKEKINKKAEIKKYFDEEVGHFKDVILFDKIFETRWLNKTTSMKSVQADIDHIFSRTSTDLMTLESTIANKEIQKQCIAFYFENITNPSVLGLAIQKARDIEEKEKKINELKSIQNNQNITNDIQNTTKSKQNLTNSTLKVTEDEELQILDFRVHVTQRQKFALKEFLKSNNIRFEPVPKQ